MCGIYFCYGESSEDEEFLRFDDQCKCMLRRRGPDFDACVQEENVSFMSTVLWLQGKERYKQPVNTDTFAFLWNGDVFQYENQTLPQEVSDTEFLADKLSKMNSGEEILDIVENIKGPWAMVFWDKVRNQVWFGRDFFGRQSLLFHWSRQRVMLASCVPSHDETQLSFTEVPAVGVFTLDLDQMGKEEGDLFTWTYYTEKYNNQDHALTICDKKFSVSERSLKPPVTINPSICHFESDHFDKIGSDCEPGSRMFDEMLKVAEVQLCVDSLIQNLTDAIRLRIENQPNLCKLCIKSGEECVHPCVGVLFSGGLDSTVLALIAAKLLKQNDDNRGLVLMNVAFSSCDGNYDVPDRITGLQALQEIRALVPDYPVEMVMVDISLEELQATRRQSISSLLYPLETVLDDSIGCAIWFAARGKGWLYRSDDNTSDANNMQKSENDNMTVLMSNKDAEENVENRVSDETRVKFVSGCRVLLTGMGIDEQLGGYSRHRGVYDRDGVAGLERELQMELLRISERNLGRDNRIISDHGVMARFPFLDENLVNYLSSLPTRIKCDLDLPRGVGEKLVLRLAAHKLGLVATAREPKRAVQFGSRIAKMENKKEKASDRAIRK